MSRFHLPPLVETINRKLQKQPLVLIGIDGCGGSGKSTLAQNLHKVLPSVTLVEGDDFYRPTAVRPARNQAIENPGSAYDWKRLYTQVIEPLNHSQSARYQKYDWRQDQLTEWHTVPATGTAIIEGVYTTRPELSEFYDIRIWVTCPRNIRLTRGLARDGEQHRDLWENEWMAAEDRYIALHNPQKQAHFLILGHPGPAQSPSTRDSDSNPTVKGEPAS